MTEVVLSGKKITKSFGYNTVQVASGVRKEIYTVSGIYQCADGMGSNIGMSLQGYSKSAILPATSGAAITFWKTV